MTRANTLEDFWLKVEKSDTCWEWRGSRTSHGYGTFIMLGKQLGAHRIAYQLLKGEIPEDLVLDHLCRNKGCVNPQHLEPVSQQVNIQRGIGVGRPRLTHCPQGHKYDALTPQGFNYCKTCKKVRSRQRRERK